MSTSAPTETKPAPAVEMLTVKVNGRPVSIPRWTPDWQGKPAPTNMIQACFAAGVMVPHYCYHPKLAVAGNCRMCLVEFGTPALGPDRKPIVNADGSFKVSKSPRPAIACATPLSPGMEIYTDTPGVKAMREGVLEFLLINHPLDCPICDQAGECKLQEYSVEYGQAESRFVEPKVHKPKAVDLGPRILLDAERCILCTRCIRFTRDVAKDDALGIINRGSYNTIATYPGRPFDNNYTLNTVDLCPVGALTSKDFRFKMRVWFLKESKNLCTSCGTGCNILVGSREDVIHRFEPRQNDAVNATWMCDAGRLNYKWIGRPDRLTELRAPQSRTNPPEPEGGQSSQPHAISTRTQRGWTEVLTDLAAKCCAAPSGSVAIVASARQTNEELFLLSLVAKRTGAMTDSIPRSGPADRLLVVADRNPNSNGARATGLSADPMGSNLARIAAAIESGAVKTLLVFGEDVTKHGISEALLRRLDLLVVSDILPNATTALAHYLLPGCAHAEKRGSFTNVKGRAQRFLKAVEPPGDARPEWEFLGELVNLIGAGTVPPTIEGLFNRMAREVPAFAGLTWGGLGDTGSNATL